MYVKINDPKRPIGLLEVDSLGATLGFYEPNGETVAIIDIDMELAQELSKNKIGIEPLSMNKLSQDELYGVKSLLDNKAAYLYRSPFKEVIMGFTLVQSTATN